MQALAPQTIAVRCDALAGAALAPSVYCVKLTDEDINEFIDVWSREFGERLSPDEARNEAALLLELYAVLAKPLPSEHQAPASPDPQAIS